MANLNKVMLIGRLTKEPEIRTFSNGGKVASFGFAVNNRKKDTTSGQWVDDPVFLDVKVFNRGEFNKLADRVEQSLHKGHQVFLEGHLVLEKWETQTGEKRSKIVVYVDNLQYLEPRGGGAGSGSKGTYQKSSAPSRSESFDSEYSDDSDFENSESGPPEDSIPF